MTLRDAIEENGLAYTGGLHALEHLLISLAPLAASCDSADLGCQVTTK